MEWNKFFRHTSSILMLITVLFTSVTNVYYWYKYNNVIQMTTVDRYSTDKEWIFANSSVFDIEMAVNFTKAIDNGFLFKKRVKSIDQPPLVASNNACFNKVTTFAGSIYAFCDRTTPEFPEWAHNFEGIIFKDVYLSTVDQFRKKSFPSFLGAMEAYRSTRKEYKDFETVEKPFCTSEVLARPVTKTRKRKLFTVQHGVLESVDCAEMVEKSPACEITRHGSSHDLLEGAAIQQFTVYKNSKGLEYIFSPWTTVALLGNQVIHHAMWPADDCLHIRGNDLAWFGLGYSDYEIMIPQSALYGKIQLALLIGLIWIIDERGNILYLYQPIVKASRLGVFFIVVLQLISAVQSEVDILKTITSWESSTFEDYLLFNYILFTYGFVVSLASLLLVRVYAGTWICEVGSILGLNLVPLAILLAYTVAYMEYIEPTKDNALIYISSLNCPQGYEECTDRSHYNRIYTTSVVSLLPLICDYYIYLRRKPLFKDRLSLRRSTNLRKEAKDEVSKRHTKHAKMLTSFESHCLQMEFGPAIVPDCKEPYITYRLASNPSTEIKLTTSNLVNSTGHSVIHGRFLCRTRDLYLLFISRYLHSIFSRNQSTVVWPLIQDKTPTKVITEKGQTEDKYFFRISGPIRVYLRDIHRVKTDAAKSIVCGQKLDIM